METLEQLRVDLERHRGNLPAIARAAEVSYQTVIDILAGRQTDPKLSTVEKLRGALQAANA